ncbi:MULTISPECIES: lipopolysaccharide assembly protein LapA domain-containing protein [unclassified Bradyrhizobium]|uniref:lipopolysaccharide assembly protein LapA domain-containing protein n=1 Tax=unclassified Bradyrhizobium TaxID=2631580 RepID=UPI0028EE4955|nr:MULTISPECIES: lipopolysaccharide assembly protein LapA domain-containing protein [unclassified Bradyrhizobium]
MRKFLTAVIVIPLALLFVVFAVANRHFVTVSFNPFDTTDAGAAVSLPLFALIIAATIVGVVAGGLATWIGQRRWRRAARQHQADADAARAELAHLKAASAATRGARGQLVPSSSPAGLFGPYGRDKQGAAL